MPKLYDRKTGKEVTYTSNPLVTKEEESRIISNLFGNGNRNRRKKCTQQSNGEKYPSTQDTSSQERE